ncbi:MAG: hypothetical protein M3O46_02415 [Myxococcota bacterium]|nr:hypothetical protein [Myxococcota bacterium]
MTNVPQFPTRRTRLAPRGDGPWRHRTRAGFIVLTALTPLCAIGCEGAQKASAAPGAKTAQGSRSEVVQHEPCNLTGNVEGLDTNGDGKPDIRRVYDGSKHELCRVVDLNHDGKADLYEYFDGEGSIRRREFCYDDTGVVNAVETYEHGKLVRREYDTTGLHKIDTWDWFDPNTPIDAKTGRPTHPIRRERDIRGVGTIDQWWTWNGDKVSIATDKNGDGKPDPETIVLLGGDDAGAPVSPGASIQPSAGDGGAVSSATRTDGGTP